jgi:hypothetical protein
VKRGGHGQLEYRRGAAQARDAAGRNATRDEQRLSAGIEEEEVEPKAHAERVDAGAAGKQQPDAGFLRPQARQPQQASPPTASHRHLATEDRRPGKSGESRR